MRAGAARGAQLSSSDGILGYGVSPTISPLAYFVYPTVFHSADCVLMGITCPLGSSREASPPLSSPVDHLERKRLQQVLQLAKQ